MNNGINCRFLGGSSEVGSAALLLETNGLKLLFEYGMSPGKPPTFPLPAPPVDLILLTHAHLDHSGMIPWLCSRSDQTILTTELTGEICSVLHKDSIKIARMEGYAPPYDSADVKEEENSLSPVEPGQNRTIGGHELRFHSAGHIPGSLMFELAGDQKILFTGDLNVIDTKLMKKGKPVACDILFIEGTYSGREHENREELEKKFLDKIDEVVNRGGVAVVPAFAVARSQEIALVLKNAGYDIWFDGMGKKISKIFLKYPHYLRSAEKLKRALNNLHLVHSNHGRKLAASNADVILTSSGMMDGGPVLHYMTKLKNDPKSAVLLTGYQVEGTNSRLLVEEGKLDFYGVVEKVECEVQYYDFSAHAGHSELVSFAKACNPEKIVLFHSDDREPLARDLKDVAEIYTPDNGEPFTL